MPVDEIRIALQSNASNLSFIWFKLHKKWNLSYNSIDCISFQDEPNWNESFLFKTFPMEIKPVALIAKTRIIARFFSGVTILLSLTVFLNLVAETLPQVSDAIPLLGTTCYRVFTEFFFSRAYAVLLIPVKPNTHEKETSSDLFKSATHSIRFKSRANCSEKYQCK